MLNTVVDQVVPLLILAHLLGDFVLQTDRLVQAKQRGVIFAHLGHAFVHAVLAYVCLGVWSLWLLPAMIGVSHGLVDFAKDAISRTVERRRGSLPRAVRLSCFAVDQAAHLAVIIIAAGVLVGPDDLPFWVERFGETAIPIAVLLLGFIMTTWVGAVIVGFAAEPYLDILTRTVRREQADNEDVAQRGFPRGGRTIGLLERALVFLLVMTGNIAGVGFLVAAKSVFRFGEIRDPSQRKDAEYILIGTLMSFTWAMFIAVSTSWALTHLGMK